MKPLLSPKLDFVFKKLLAGDTGILTDLLNSVLKPPGKRRIRSVEVRNPVILPEEITQKYIVLDILATDDSGQSYEIEMQIRRYESYPKRALYYLSRIYAGQLNSGEDYEKLKPVIGIHFLDYEMFPDVTDFHFCFGMRDIRHPKLRLTDDMTLHIFELPKFGRTAGQTDDALGEWLHFFNHAHEEDKTMRAAYKTPAIHKAFDMLETLSADETVRHLARVREDALRNERSELFYAEKRGLEKGLEKGRKEGEYEKAVKTAKNLLEMGVLTTEQIGQATGLGKKEILKIRKSLDKKLIS